MVGSYAKPMTNLPRDCSRELTLLPQLDRLLFLLALEGIISSGKTGQTTLVNINRKLSIHFAVMFLLIKT